MLHSNPHRLRSRPILQKRFFERAAASSEPDEMHAATVLRSSVADDAAAVVRTESSCRNDLVEQQTHSHRFGRQQKQR